MKSFSSPLNSMLDQIYFVLSLGKPLPSVHWYRDNVLIDSSASIVDDSVVRNELRIENILRSDLNSIYSCRAINNNSSQTTVSTFVTFDIYGQICLINLFVIFQNTLPLFSSKITRDSLIDHLNLRSLRKFI